MGGSMVMSSNSSAELWGLYLCGLSAIGALFVRAGGVCVLLVSLLLLLTCIDTPLSAFFLLFLLPLLTQYTLGELHLPFVPARPP